MAPGAVPFRFRLIALSSVITILNCLIPHNNHRNNVLASTTSTTTTRKTTTTTTTTTSWSCVSAFPTSTRSSTTGSSPSALLPTSTTASTALSSRRRSSVSSSSVLLSLIRDHHQSQYNTLHERQRRRRRLNNSQNSRMSGDMALRQRGGGGGTGGSTTTALELSSSSSSALSAAAAAVVPTEGPATPPKSRIRIAAFDSMRFFLIGCIVLGHFIKFANPNDFIFKLFSQHNVIVGAFFALSGYVTAYTSTEVGQQVASPKFLSAPTPQWTLSKVFGWYPLHFIVLTLFSPLFIYADTHYNGWLATLWHGFLSITLTQAWFPLHAEVWNAPTWYLSGLAFATAIMPFCLPKLAQMNKPSLRKTAVWLTIWNVLPKLGYLYDLNTWYMPEGWTNPKVHPNLTMFNIIRFNPALITAEVLLGAVACRLVMLDEQNTNVPQDTKGNNSINEKPIQTNALSTMVPLLGIVGTMLFRATDVWPVSDMLVRPLIFLPLFLKFLMACHRNTVRRQVISGGGGSNVDPLVSCLSHPFLVWLGTLSFPIYLVHGPLGQVFYKKLIAQRLFGQVLTGPINFGLYLTSVLLLAWILQTTVLPSKVVAQWTKSTVEKLSLWM